MQRYRQNNMCGTLKAVMLGTFFLPDFFTTIKAEKVREPLMRVADEIQKDLYQIEKTLKNNGIIVERSKQPQGRFGEIDHRINSIAVRNNHVVVGDKLIQLQKNDYVLSPLLAYCKDIVDVSDQNKKHFIRQMANAVVNYNPNNDIWYSKSKYIELAGTSWPPYQDYVNGSWINFPQKYIEVKQEILSFKESMEYYTHEIDNLQGPNVLNYNDKIIIDCNEYLDYTWFEEIIGDGRPLIYINTKAGHTDGVFMPINDSTILGISEVIDNLKVFADHNKIRVPEEAYQNQITEFNMMKNKVSGRWWIPGQEENTELIEFTENVLSTWTGRAEESVFDVNLLVLDQKTVMINRVDDIVVPQLKKNKIDYILVPWRHRFFIDNGLHCITLDLYREDH